MKNVEFCETKAAIKNLKTLLLYNVISIFSIVTNPNKIDAADTEIWRSFPKKGPFQLFKFF